MPYRTSYPFDKRVCYACDSTKTFVKNNGQPQWALNRINGKITHVICHKCEQTILNRLKYLEWLRKHRSTNIRFKSRKIRLDRNPRTGVCNWCRAVAPFDTYKTHMHHEQYHEDNPTKDMIEVCISCHIRETNKHRTILRDEKNGRIIGAIYS